jgi:ABC-2 type transport system ATP-binding protein
MASGDVVLAADHLTKQYKNVVALNDVSFTISDGITGILGENGAGKSTAIKIFLGLVRPTSGTVTVLGRARLREYRGAFQAGLHAGTRLSAQPGQRGGVPDPYGRVERTPSVSGPDPGGRHAAAHRTVRGAIPGHRRYSTGMKQRVKLGQALVHDPAFVFLDEPTAGLDPLGREEMLTLVRKTHRDFGISVLFSSHLMADVERTCDRIIVLQGGRLVQSGEVGQFTRETETVFIEVDTNREQLIAALGRRGIVVTPDGSGLTSRAPTNRCMTRSAMRWWRPRPRCAAWRLGAGRWPSSSSEAVRRHDRSSA